MEGLNVFFHPIISFIQKMAVYETKMVSINIIQFTSHDIFFLTKIFFLDVLPDRF